MGEFQPRSRDQREVDEPFDCLIVLGPDVPLDNTPVLDSLLPIERLDRVSIEFCFDRLADGRVRRSTVMRFQLIAVERWRIMTGCDHYSADRFLLLDRVGNGRR